MAEKKVRKFGELTKAFSEILRVSEKYSYLFDEGLIEEGILNIGGGWIAQDERFSINVGKYGSKFLIGGNNFDYEGEGLSSRKAALRIKNHFSTFTGLEANDLRKRFYLSLGEPLGKYLARKELSDLTDSVT